MANPKPNPPRKAARVAIESAAGEKIAQLTAQLASQADLLAEARDKLAETLAEKKDWRDHAKRAADECDRLIRHNDMLRRQDGELRHELATAQGYIAALKGEPLPAPPLAVTVNTNGKASIREVLARTGCDDEAPSSGGAIDPRRHHTPVPLG